VFNNYFKIACRNLWKNKFFSAVNIIGLSAGIAFALLIGAYVWNELEVNRNLNNTNQQYILTSEWKDPNMGYDLATLGPLAKRLREEYPALIKNYYRFDGITSVVSQGDKHLRESMQLGDSTMIAMYGFKLFQGNAKTALNQPYTVVITKEMAIKYFGNMEVVGQSLNIQSFSGENHAFTVTGVLKDLPENSVTHLNNANINTIFIPISNYTYFGRWDPDNWSNIQIASYVELQNGITVAHLKQAISQLLKNNTTDIIQKNLTVRPVLLKDYYLQKDGSLVKGMLYTLSFIGLFILLMAVVNFINISISSASNRTREIGVRKVLGSMRSQLIAQFLIESLILVSIATSLAIVCFPFAKTAFGSMVGKIIPALSSFPLYFILVPVLLVLLVALLAGLYPAFVLSSLKAVNSLKGKLKTGKENILLRRSLVGFQFCIALVVMIAAMIITQQVTHFFGKNLGYNKEYIVSSQVPRDWTRKGTTRMETIRNEFAQMPQITEATLSFEIPNGMNGGQPPVYRAGSDSLKAIAMDAMVTDEHYLATYQIVLKEGSFFDGHALDSGKVIMNEEAVHSLGYKNIAEAIGQQVRIPQDPTIYTVKGVTTNFHFGSMQQRIAPIIFFNVHFAISYRYLSFKIKPGNVNAEIEAIQKKWAQLIPGSSFEYSFMDDALANLYSTEMQLKKAAYAATGLTLIIMLLGVLGLISVSIQKRLKEIGVRKVLGASVPDIMLLFVKNLC